VLAHYLQGIDKKQTLFVVSYKYPGLHFTEVEVQLSADLGHTNVASVTENPNESPDC